MREDQRDKAGIRGGMAIAPGGKRAVRAAADSSGPRRNDRGERVTEKRKLERGFARARVPAGVDARRVLALKVADEKTGGAPAFEAPVTGAVAAPDGAAARGEARGKEAGASGEKEGAAAAIAAEAARPAPGESAAARAVAADDGGTAREREPEASVPAAAAAAPPPIRPPPMRARPRFPRAGGGPAAAPAPARPARPGAGTAAAAAGRDAARGEALPGRPRRAAAGRVRESARGGARVGNAC